MGKLSIQQKKYMCEFVKSKPQLLSGKFTKNVTQADGRKLWEQLADMLNSMGATGTTKTWKHWRKTWHDLRSRTKNKLSEHKRQHRATGGGPYTVDELTSIDQDILEIIKPVSIDGHTSSQESSCTIVLDQPDAVASGSDDVEFTANESGSEWKEIVFSEQQHHAEIMETPKKQTMNVEFIVAEQKSGHGKLGTNNSIPAATPKARIIPKRRPTIFKNTSAAAEKYSAYLEQKLQISQKYNDEKIALLKEIVICKKAKVEALNRIGTVLEELII